MTEVEPTVAPPVDFEGFFSEESERLFRRLWLVTRDRAEAEDIVQDAFIVVLERWDRVRVMEEPAGYLYRIAFNAWRKRSRRASRVVQRAVTAHREQADPFDGADARTVIGAALETLTARQRAALVLTELVGMTSEEAASLLKVRAVTVRVLSSQARASMRQRIGGTDA